MATSRRFPAAVFADSGSPHRFRCFARPFPLRHFAARAGTEFAKNGSSRTGLDAEEAEKVQVCVDDLPRIECSAVYNHWLSTNRSIGDASPELAYASAVTLLRMAFSRRGVLRS